MVLPGVGPLASVGLGPMAKFCPCRPEFLSIREAYVGLSLSPSSLPIVAQSHLRPSVACPRGYLWIPVGCRDPSLGFPASATKVCRFGALTRSLFDIPD